MSVIALTVGVLVIEARQERAPLAADADEADADLAPLDRALDHRGRAERGDCRYSGNGLQEVPAAVGHLFRCQVHASISSVAPL